MLAAASGLIVPGSINNLAALIFNLHYCSGAKPSAVAAYREMKYGGGESGALAAVALACIAYARWRPAASMKRPYGSSPR